MTKVTINGFDLDEVIVSGSALTHSVQTGSRFNSETYNNPHSLNDQWKYTRYFPKSGTYRMKVIYNDGGAGGIIDFGIDSPAGNNLIDGLDTQSSSGRNKERFTTAEISRGNHDISILCQADGGASDYQFAYHMIQFDLINEHPVLGAEGVRKSSGVSWEEIGRKKIHQAEASINVKIPEKRLLRVEVSGIKSGNLLLYLRFNGDATGTDTSSGNYSQRLNVNGGTDDTTGEQNRTQISLSSGSDAQTFSEFEIVNILDEEKIVIIHTLMRGASAGSGSSPDRMEYVGKWDVVTSLINEINIVASSTTFASGSEVVIYGHD